MNNINDNMNNINDNINNNQANVDALQIGTTRIGTTTSTTKWFYLQPGENLYRILPPLFNLAKTGQFSYYHKFHSGFKNSNGKIRMFRCIEEINRETKSIIKECPICNMVQERRAQYDLAKNQGTSKEELERFFYTAIRPYETQRKWFLNVINQNNEIGILSIPTKLHSAVRIFLKTQLERGIDPTGGEGIFLKFTKSQQYPGDRDTSYSVDFAFEVDPANPSSYRLKKHYLTPEIINAIKKQSRDLSQLFRSITAEDMVALVQASSDQQPALIDRLFGSNEPKPEINPLISNIPNTAAQAVHHIELTSDGMKVSSPKFANASSVNTALNAAGVNCATPNTSAPINPASFSNNSSNTSAPITSLSDEEFFAKFMGQH